MKKSWVVLLLVAITVSVAANTLFASTLPDEQENAKVYMMGPVIFNQVLKYIGSTKPITVAIFEEEEPDSIENDEADLEINSNDFRVSTIDGDYDYIGDNAGYVVVFVPENSNWGSLGEMIGQIDENKDMLLDDEEVDDPESAQEDSVATTTESEPDVEDENENTDNASAQDSNSQGNDYTYVKSPFMYTADSARPSGGCSLIR